ncbi:hypothetical protein [Bradyrhizobium sp. B117]|uniref:hypothetical protein n=1 Tax=Bradyrhizobium sp. B117 TaxID=3140246 RepID=UPI0031845E25
MGDEERSERPGGAEGLYRRDPGRRGRNRAIHAARSTATSRIDRRAAVAALSYDEADLRKYPKN